MSHPEKYVFRCYAERRKNGICEAFCIDLNLAAQGDSLQEVRIKLDAMVVSYVQAACTEHRAHKSELLNRPAPLSIRLRYWRAWFLFHVYQAPHRAKSAVLDAMNAVSWMVRPPLTACA